MKFLAILALLGSAAAVKITHQASVSTNIAAKIHAKSQAKDFNDLTDDQQGEVLEWVYSELSGGTADDTITAEEAQTFFEDFMQRHNLPISQEVVDAIVNGFNFIDDNGNGSISRREFKQFLRRNV